MTGEIRHTFATLWASLDVSHIVWGWVRTVQFGLRRRRKHHKVTNQRRGVASIDFVDTAMSGYATLTMLKRYGVPAWAGPVLGEYVENKQRLGTALKLHVPASQETWARYLMARHGVMVLGSTPNIGDDKAGKTPQAWSDGGQERSAEPGHAEQIAARARAANYPKQGSQQARGPRKAKSTRKAEWVRGWLEEM